jgi:two-component system, NtrC family, nitrogen regulation response regulator GlnG
MQRRAQPRDFLVAESPAMRAVVESIGRYAEIDRPVLICGEHGTGRELVARVLHLASPRRKARFVAVRPTLEGPDVPDGIDDADGRARHVLRAAAGGTLLIKDVVDLPAATQKSLRRAIRVPGSVLEERARRRGADTPIEAYDVRVVGSGDHDLEGAVDARILSRDLYEQMSGQRIDVPPLRERLADIPSLFERWVRHYGDEVGRTRVTVSTRAHGRLVKYPWPGNVAELKATARRLVVRIKGAKVEAGDVDEVLPKVAERVPLEEMAFEEMVKAKLAGFLERMDGYPVHDLYEKVVQRVERPLLELVLQHTGGNQVKAAELLGLNRNTLRKKLADLDLEGSPRARRRKGRQDAALD